MESKQRDIYLPELREALDFLEAHIRPEWLIFHFCYHAQLNDKNHVDKEAQQQALRVIFPVMRESVKDLLKKQMDTLTRQFAVDSRYEGQSRD